MKEEIVLESYEIAAILYWDYVEDFDEYYDEKGDLLNGIWNNFEYIQEDLSYFSLEDGYQETRVIVKRLSDGKFFEGFYTSYDDYTRFDNLILTEVFPVEKTIIIYE